MGVAGRCDRGCWSCTDATGDAANEFGALVGLVRAALTMAARARTWRVRARGRAHSCAPGPPLARRLGWWPRTRGAPSQSPRACCTL
eukprot:461429-Prymnesium_polylepis.1